MIGGKASDIYIVDNIADIVIENADEGIDTVQSVTTYALTDNIENLTLIGTRTINGTGNSSLDNILLGNSANNVLNGGIGADLVQGGLGNDTYIVDNIGDTIIEFIDESGDTVQSSISYTLFHNVENLTLTGSDALNSTGNALNNILTGNTANNVLDGQGGIDTMKGGLGDDTYINLSFA